MGYNDDEIKVPSHDHIAKFSETTWLKHGF